MSDPAPAAAEPVVAACDACLRRTWLVAALAGGIELAWLARRPLPEVLALPDAELIAALGGKARSAVAAGWAAFEPELARARARAAGLAAVCGHDARYPAAAFKELNDAPAILHVHGGGLERLGALLAEPVGAIVGARRASPYGMEVARALGRDLAAVGITVVSGMALGVDAAAHAGALEAPGATIAVLAGGADRPYPASKRGLHARIATTGCVISELPPGFGARRWCFPARNRIIAALASATIVVEAAARSGSLITAGVARSLGREVGAVPGRVTTRQAAGANALIFDGAQLVRDAQDVLDLVLGAGALRAPGPRVRRAPLERPLRELLDAVADGRDTIAALAASPEAAQSALAGLAELELLGYLRRGAGGRYAVVP